MSSTGADRTNQGCIHNVVCRDSNPAQGSHYPQNSDPSLSTVSVRGITPRDTPIHWNFSGTWLATGCVVRTWDWFVYAGPR